MNESNNTFAWAIGAVAAVAVVGVAAYGITKLFSSEEEEVKPLVKRSVPDFLMACTNEITRQSEQAWAKDQSILSASDIDQLLKAFTVTYNEANNGSFTKPEFIYGEAEVNKKLHKVTLVLDVFTEHVYLN